MGISAASLLDFIVRELNRHAPFYALRNTVIDILRIPFMEFEPVIKLPDQIVPVSFGNHPLLGLPVSGGKVRASPAGADCGFSNMSQLIFNSHPVNDTECESK